MSVIRETARGGSGDEVLAGELARMRRDFDALRSTVLPRAKGVPAEIDGGDASGVFGATIDGGSA